jgi:hypothetical protein
MGVFIGSVNNFLIKEGSKSLHLMYKIALNLRGVAADSS